MIRDIGERFAEADYSRKRLVEFRLRRFRRAQRVYLASDLSTWMPGTYPMERVEDGWRIVLPLHEGKFLYTFVVDGCRWVLDRDNPETTEIPFEWAPVRMCSAAHVGAATPTAPDAKGRTGEGPAGLCHDQTPLFFDLEGGTLAVKLRLREHRETNAWLHFVGPNRIRVAMEKLWSDSGYDWFEATEKVGGSRGYFFEVSNGGTPRFFSASGTTENADGVKPFPLVAPGNTALGPSRWARGAVFYHVLVDRFCNGDKGNDPPHTVAWDTIPSSNLMQTFGGDLRGILDKMEHFDELGVDALYLTPVFRSRTWHKYDTEDYDEIDPTFGDKALFQTVVREAHRRGIKVILDGTFPHTGLEFWAFRDLLENQQRSQYVDWFLVRRFPVRTKENLIERLLFRSRFAYAHFRLRHRLRAWFPVSYETFLDAPSMPKVNLLGMAASEYFLSIAERWTREADLDGWRLDSAMVAPLAFWKRFRERVRKVNPDAYFMGEVECEPGGKACMANWIHDEAFDAVMNYWLRGIITDFAVNETIGVNELDEKLREYRARMPRRSLNLAYNILSSTETPRLFSLCNGDLRKIRLAALFQMTFPGAPVICYGDEIGLPGAERFSTNRSPMKWRKEEWNMEILDFFKKLVRIRKDHPALRTGCFRVVVKDAERGVFGFSRETAGDHVVTILNNSAEARDIAFPMEGVAGAKDLLSGRIHSAVRNNLRVSIPAKTGVVLCALDAI